MCVVCSADLQAVALKPVNSAQNINRGNGVRRVGPIAQFVHVHASGANVHIR